MPLQVAIKKILLLSKEMYVVGIIISGMKLEVIETRTYARAFSRERAQITCKGLGIGACHEISRLAKRLRNLFFLSAVICSRMGKR